jgi:hypothetical protein
MLFRTAEWERLEERVKWLENDARVTVKLYRGWSYGETHNKKWVGGIRAILKHRDTGRQIMLQCCKERATRLEAFDASARQLINFIAETYKFLI